MKRRGRIAPLLRAGEKVHYTQDLWPFVLLGVLALFLLDLYAKRVRLFGYRTIKVR